MVGSINFENRRRNLIPELNTTERLDETQEKHVSVFVIFTILKSSYCLFSTLCYNGCTGTVSFFTKQTPASLAANNPPA